MFRPQRTLIFFLSLILIMAFSLPFFRGDFFLTHDYTHIARLAEMRLALEAGHLPVHWAQNLGFGYGMPLFLFYGPLPFYLGTLATYVGFSYIGATKLLFFLSGVLAFSGMYSLLQRWGRSGALVGATLLTAAPYRALDIFIRGALNEVFAIGLLPWILRAGFAIKERKAWAVPLLAASVGALIMTHNITAMVALPLLGLFTLIWLLINRSKTWVREVIELAVGYIWGFLLALWYIIPAFIEKSGTAIGSILSGYFDYHLHFLYIRQFLFSKWGFGGSEYGPNDGMSFHLSWIAMALVGFSGFVFLWRWWSLHKLEKTSSLLLRLQVIRRRLPTQAWLIPLSGVFLAVTLFFTLERSVSLWETLPLISFLQFPWRLLGIAIVFLSFTAGLGISLVTPFPRRWAVTFLAIVCVLPLTRFHAPEKYYPNADGHFTSDPIEIRGNLSSVLPDYIPSGFDQKLPQVSPEKRIVMSSGQPITWETNKPHELIGTLSQPEVGTVTWNIADFPGWQYFVNDQEVYPEVLADGRRSFTSDQPITNVAARFALTPLRQTTLVVSLIALILLASTLPWRKHA